MADETTMPTPSKVEKLKERMRNKQGLESLNDPVKSSVLGAPPPPAMVKHACGHEAPFQEIAKDKFRNERYQKEFEACLSGVPRGQQSGESESPRREPGKKESAFIWTLFRS